MVQVETVGVLGGLGPGTTSGFNLAVTNKFLALDSTQRPPILSLYIGINLEVEREFVEHAKGGERYIPYLIDGAKRLERGGSDFIVIPYNSVHIYIDKVRNAVGVPVLSIVEETEKFLTGKGIGNVGILATPITVQSRLYHDPLERAGIEVVSPQNHDLEELGGIIDRLVEQKQTSADHQSLLRINDDLVLRGASSILLACTDLQLLMSSLPNVYDTMDILAESTARRLAKI